MIIIQIYIAIKRVKHIQTWPENLEQMGGGYES